MFDVWVCAYIHIYDIRLQSTEGGGGVVLFILFHYGLFV